MRGVRNIQYFNSCTRTQKPGPRPGGPSRGREASHPTSKMPFYQILCIAAHNPEYVRDEVFCIPCLAFSSWPLQRQIKSLVRLAATHILNGGGVVRGIQYWGTESLPQRMRSHGTNRDYGECVLSLFFQRPILKRFPLSATGRCILTRTLKSRKA